MAFLKSPGRTAAATSVVLDHYLLGTSPQTFYFNVLSPGTVKELVFRNDGPAPGVFGDLVYRASLNGFVLTSCAGALDIRAARNVFGGLEHVFIRVSDSRCSPLFDRAPFAIDLARMRLRNPA